MSNSSFSLKCSLSLLLVVPALVLSGCALSGGSSSTPAGTSLLPTTTAVESVNGHMRGGQQAIYKATITLYEMNTATTSYGAAPIQVATTTTATNGAFSFTKGADGGVSSVTGNTYACPATASGAAAAGTVGTAVDPEMYLVGSGGDTSGTINSGNTASAYNNAAAKFVLAIGDCESLTSTTPVVMDEVTTVGTMVALQQYFNPVTENIGAPATGVAGLVNAVGMISNLVSISTGAAQQGVTPTSNVAGITVTATPEYQKLDTMANILAACVSSNPTGKTNPNPVPCADLQAAALAPPSQTATNVPNDSGYVSATFAYPAATDTLLAVYYMSTNPTDSQNLQGTYGGTAEGALDALYSLPGLGSSPFQPSLSAEPADWTVGVGFLPSGTCTNTTATGTAAGSAAVAQTILLGTYGEALDAKGNLWLGGTGGSTTTGLGVVLAEFSPSGGALQCINGASSTTATSGLTAGRRIAIDSKGNVWFTTSQGIVEQVQDPTNAAAGQTLLWPNPTGIAADGIAADSSGDIFIAPDAAPKAPVVATIYEYPQVASDSSAYTTTTAILPLSTASMGTTADPGDPYRDITINKYGDLVTEGSAAGANVYTYVPLVPGSTTSGYTQTKVTVTGGGSTTYGMALESDGVTSVGGNTCCAAAGKLYNIDPTQGSAATDMVGYSAIYAGGQNADRTITVDGAGNVWSGGAPYANEPTGTLTSVAETAAPATYTEPYTAVAISPQGVTPTTCTTTAGDCEVNGGYSKSFFPIDNIYALEIDNSGNVWGADDATTAPIFWVIVGTAVPVTTPVVNAIPTL